MKVCEESMQQRVTTMKTAQDKRVNVTIAGEEHTQVITVVPLCQRNAPHPKLPATADSKMCRSLSLIHAYVEASPLQANIISSHLGGRRPHGQVARCD
jgi:hypothetical protein